MYCEFKASQTGLLDQQYLSQARQVMTADEYAQEFECSWEAAVKGAIYAKEMEAARAAGRITSVPYDPALPVDTDWDLGIGDAMAVWFSQSTRGGEVRLIDYLEGSGEGFPFYARALAAKGYVYGHHWAPHDIQVRELSSGRSRLEVAASQGEVEEGIHALRMLFPRMWFDAEKCKDGLEALMHYRRDYNQKLNEFKATPVHDWASHGCDAARGLAVRHQIPKEAKKRRLANMPLEWGWT
jgi:phage terminase large subunit